MLYRVTLEKGNETHEIELKATCAAMARRKAQKIVASESEYSDFHVTDIDVYAIPAGARMMGKATFQKSY